jgi:hypothetical protein
MNELSILTTIENNIKALDVEALQKANTAKQNISEACKVGVQIGELLKEAQNHTGRNNYKGWLMENFGEDFAKRSVKYRRVADDPKQMALALGVVTSSRGGIDNTGGGSKTIKAKPATHLVYTNKLGAYLRNTKQLNDVDKVALTPIVNDLKRLGLV